RRSVWVEVTPMSLRQRTAHGCQVLERDAHRRAVRTALHACGALRPAETQVAFGRKVDFAIERRARERHLDDVSPRAAAHAVPAADARVLVNRDFQRSERPRDGARRAADHADRIGALITGGRNAPGAELVPFPNESRHAAMRFGAAADAVVAA